MSFESPTDYSQLYEKYVSFQQELDKFRSEAVIDTMRPYLSSVRKIKSFSEFCDMLDEIDEEYKRQEIERWKIGLHTWLKREYEKASFERMMIEQFGVPEEYKEIYEEAERIAKKIIDQIEQSR